jgi:hypothetical protein
MAQETEFAIGAKASCSDGSCGELRRLVIDPATDTVTHLVISGHRREDGRLVPVGLAENTVGEIRLRCTRAEFDKLDRAEESELVEGTPGGGGGLLGDALVHEGGEAYAPAGPGELLDVGPQPIRRRVSIQDVVPEGETQVRRGDHVHAVDGEIGRVKGFLVDPENHRVTHVLLQEGHLWGRKEVAIPIGAVTEVDDGARLNISKQQVENLPPVDIDH